MLTTFKVCKLYLLVCVVLSVNASPILYGAQSNPTEFGQSGSSFHHESSFSSYPAYDSTKIKTNLKPSLTFDQSLSSAPGVTTTFRDQNGNLVTQVKKEIFNNNNGQTSHAFEFQENKQLPNGYSKSFKKEYSSSSAIESLPNAYAQNPLDLGKYSNSEQHIDGESNLSGQSIKNNYGSMLSDNSENVGIKSNFKSTIGQSITNVPGVTTTFRDQHGNIVTQVKKELVNNDNGQNSHALELEETKQLPNGYAKSYKKEYSSSSIIGSQPILYMQNPLNVNQYSNSEKLINAESSLFGQSVQNNYGSMVTGNSENVGVPSNFKSTVGQSITKVPEVTTTFTRDQYGNIVTQVKKELVSNDNGQNSHTLELEETKKLPNGYAKSYKREYSSSSVTGSQPISYVQNPLNVNQYSNSEKLINGQSSFFGQSVQNNHGSMVTGNFENVGIPSNFKSTVDVLPMSNVPAVTTTFRDQYGNIVTQVKKESVNNDNGKNSHGFELEETKQLPNGYAKSFKKEYSSSFVTGSQPTLIKDTKFEINPSLPQKLTNGDTKQLDGYNTFFNSYKYPLNPNGPINAQIINNQKTTDINIPSVNDKAYSSSYQGYNQQTVNLKTYSKSPIDGQQPININYLSTPKTPIRQFEKIETISTQKQDGGQQPVDLHSSVTGQQSVNIDHSIKPIKPIIQQYEKIQSFSTHRQGQVGQQSLDSHGLSKPSQIGQESINLDYLSNPKQPCDQQLEKITQEQEGQHSVDLHGFSKPSQIGQESVNLDYLSKPKYPYGQKLEKIESFSTQKQEGGQQSVDMQSSVTGQESINIDHLIKPIGQQYEKVESYSTHTQEKGQQSVDSHDFSKPSQIGQESVNLDYLSKPKYPYGQQLEKIESFSTQKQEGGQQSVDLHSSVTGQESINIDHLVKPIGKQYEKIESYSTYKQEQVGQQSVDSHDFSKPSQIGQESVNLDYLSKPKYPYGQQLEKIESFSTQKQEGGQQSVDLHSSVTGQESINIDHLVKPIGKQYEKIESYSTHKQEQVGQQSVDSHDFSKPSQIGQESVNLDYLSKPKYPYGQQLEKIESFSTQKQEGGQQSVDLHSSVTGQESINIDHLVKPIGKQYEKIESYSTHKQEQVGQQSVDLHGFSKPSQIGQESINVDHLYTPKNPFGKQFEKIEATYQNRYESEGNRPANTNGKSNQQFDMGQQSISQGTPGQQIQGLDILASKYSDTTHMLDLGVLGQQPSEYYTRGPSSGQQYVNNDNILASSKPFSQQTIGVFEGHSTFEKNTDLSSSDHLPINIDNYQTLSEQSMKSPITQGQQIIDFSSNFEKNTPTQQNQQFGSIGFQNSQLNINKNQPINPTYNSVFDKLGQLEHEILGAKSTVNINKDNFQTSYGINHNVKSMPVQTNKQESHYSKTINENSQYIEPESEMVSGSNGHISSSSFTEETKSVMEQGNIENLTKEPTTHSSVWKTIGDKFKGTIQNAKYKAQQIASSINNKVGFSSVTENP